jgi:primosomal protein N'
VIHKVKMASAQWNNWGTEKLTKCPDCDGPLEYDQASGTYYCPKCMKHREPIEVEEKKSMWQDTTTGDEPVDQKELEEQAEEAKNK